MPVLPDNGAKPNYRTWFPPADGYRGGIFTVPPRRRAEVDQHGPGRGPGGLMDVMDPKHPGWHTTDTIDLIYVMSGGCVLKTGHATLGAIRERSLALFWSCRSVSAAADGYWT